MQLLFKGDCEKGQEFATDQAKMTSRFKSRFYFIKVAGNLVPFSNSPASHLRKQNVLYSHKITLSKSFPAPNTKPASVLPIPVAN